jgi:hypothetical protein
LLLIATDSVTVTMQIYLGVGVDANVALLKHASAHHGAPPQVWMPTWRLNGIIVGR